MAQAKTRLSSLESLVRQADERSCKLMSFRWDFWGRSVQATWRKLPRRVLTSCFSVSAQRSLKRHSERLLLFELSIRSSLSRINYVFVNFDEKSNKKKKVTTRTLHWARDAKTSFHLHTVAYDHARTDSVPLQGRRCLELCQSVDCAVAPRFLEAVHVYIHFRAYWACLVVIETNEKPGVAAWRSVDCLAIVEGGKTDARGSSSSPLRSHKAPKCVWREYVRSVSLRFHGFWAW